MYKKFIWICTEKFVATWFRTGDLGFYDKDGEIYVAERINQCFQLSLSESSNKITPHLISPILIENVLQDHKAVFEVVVTSIWGPDKYKYPIAFVSLMFGQEV